MLKDPLSLHPGDLAVNHVIEYMKKHTPLTTSMEGRISFTEEKLCLSSKSSILHTHHAHFLMSMIIIISCYSKTWKTEKYEIFFYIYTKYVLRNTENSCSLNLVEVYFWKLSLLHNQRRIEHSRKHVRWRAL